jgi:hypothetical protein
MFLGLASASVALADFNPVPLTPGSFTFDIIVESNAAPPITAKAFTTASMDAGVGNTGYGWFEKGFNTASPLRGLPAAGTSFTSLSASDHQYQMPPTYTTNNAIFLDSTHGGTFTLGTAAAYTGLSILGSSGNGAQTINYTIHYSDSSVQGGSISIPDWFNATGFAITATGRCDVSTYAVDTQTAITTSPGNPRLYGVDFALTNTTTTVVSVDFVWSTGGGRSAIFGLSASTGAGYAPIAVSGFTQDMICEASARGNLKAYTSATMDQGTNNGANTWFEQGYVPTNSTVGLPHPGTLITSTNKPDHHYIMAASYSGPNGVLIDTNHQSALITPLNPTNYTAFSLLTAGGNIGGANTMTNLCVMLHADGSVETNLFYGYDWFATKPAAFNANGRVSSDDRTLNTINGGNPKLFESEFFLANIVSPVTNILVLFRPSLQTSGAALSSSATTFIMAVSATAGGVVPVVGNSPSPVNVYQGSNAQFTVSLSAGTSPLSYHWQVGTNGVFVNLSNGGHFSGATSNTLTISSADFSNAANYQVVITNAAGAVTSSPAALTVLSPMVDVTVPGDTISSFGDAVAPPAAQVVSHAIDNLTSRWLSYGTDGDTVAPFAGPVGLVVSPSIGSTFVTGLRFYTAADSPERDPADFMLEGSSDGVNFSLITSNALALPDNRNTDGAGLSPMNQFLQEIDFPNPTSYYVYRLTFFDVKTNSIANSLQVGEIEFLGVQAPAAPFITKEPANGVTLYAGGNVSMSVSAIGLPAPSYQWVLNGTTAIPGATSSSFTATNVQISGSAYSCTVSNIYGTTNSTSLVVTVLPAPTNPYPAAILADHPLAFWRLGETTTPSDGSTAYDFVGGHNGYYTNTLVGVNGYRPALDPDTAVTFGSVSASDSHVAGIPGLDFGAASNVNSSFSVECWVLGGSQTTDCGLLSRGAGNAGEQFDLDCGAPGTHAFRFFVRGANSNNLGNAVGTIGPDPNTWHHVVGVCDEANGRLLLYVDGVLNGVGAVQTNGGIMANWSGDPVSIGSRRQSTFTSYNLNFIGSIDEAAIYGYALSSNQVQNHYLSAGVVPVLTTVPTDTTASEGGTATFHSKAYGSPVLRYQWYDGGSSLPIAGKTSADLVFNNVSASLDQSFYWVVVTNAFGAVTSSPVVLTVVSGPPQIISDIAPLTTVYAGRSASMSVQVGGTPPFTYQWTHEGTNVVDGPRFSGAHTATFSVNSAQLSDGGIYAVNITNSHGNTASSPGILEVEVVADFNTNGIGWAFNSFGGSGGMGISGDVYTVTDDSGSEASSSWYVFPQYVGAFNAFFTYQDVTIGGADGIAFVLQNDPRGTNALGGQGGSLGYGLTAPITPSVALEFNIYSGSSSGIGIGFGTNGSVGPYSSVSPVSLSGGDPIDVSISYSQGVLHYTLTDELNTATTYSGTINVGDIPTLVGGTSAYVGITGACGGVAAKQTVSNFSFYGVPALSVQNTATNTVVVSWPASVGGYTLQSKTDLSAAWSDVTAPITVAGGQNQVVVTPVGKAFYRLSLTLQ